MNFISFNDEEVKGLKAIGIEIKESYTDDEIVDMIDIVGDAIINNLKGDNYTVTDLALLYERIIDRLTML